jgi:hypothetical protein
MTKSQLIMQIFFRITDRFLLTLWVGGMWALGYIAAPVLFNTIPDRALAGLLAGKMFHVMSMIGMLCGGLLLVSLFWRRRSWVLRHWQFWVILVMLGLVALGFFYVQPLIAHLRELSPALREAEHFKQWHGLAQLLYLVTSIGGLLLVLLGVEREPPTASRIKYSAG